MVSQSKSVPGSRVHQKTAGYNVVSIYILIAYCDLTPAVRLGSVVPGDFGWLARATDIRRNQFFIRRLKTKFKHQAPARLAPRAPRPGIFELGLVFGDALAGASLIFKRGVSTSLASCSGFFLRSLLGWYRPGFEPLTDPRIAPAIVPGSVTS